jgi:hypothetical protein
MKNKGVKNGIYSILKKITIQNMFKFKINIFTPEPKRRVPWHQPYEIVHP